jgi:drug/metabolite transporter superfamily protein YnfA
MECVVARYNLICNSISDSSLVMLIVMLLLVMLLVALDASCGAGRFFSAYCGAGRFFSWHWTLLVALDLVLVARCS